MKESIGRVFDNLQDLMTRIDEIYQNLNHLELQPTEHNVTLLDDCYMKLHEVYAILDLSKKRMEETKPANENEPSDEQTGEE